MFSFALPARRVLSRAFAAALLLFAVLCPQFGCRTNRISGTYVSHGPNFANMLALTEATSGDITGVLTTDTLDPSGQISTNSISITQGAFDNGQLTLSLRPQIFGENISGTKKGDTIRFDMIGPQGQILSSEFVLSSGANFKLYVDQLAAKGKGITTSIQVLKSTRDMAKIAERAQQWIVEANIHVQRIPGVEDRFLRIEEKMRRLVELERSSHSNSQRSQISVEVNQGDVAATQADIEVDNFWEENIESPGLAISTALLNNKASCSNDLAQKAVIAPDTLQSWENACSALQTTLANFDLIYKQTSASRNDEKSFQASERAHRKFLVDESTQLAH